MAAHSLTAFPWGPAMPNRRTMELVVITVVLVHPVIRLGRVWAAKHLATSANPVSKVAAETVSVLA